MVQVGPVFVVMFYVVVFMPVHMACLSRIIMIVVMMSVCVSMAMLVRYRIMSVTVCMLLGEEQHQRSSNDPGCQRLNPSEGLFQNGYRKHQSEERRC